MTIAQLALQVERLLGKSGLLQFGACEFRLNDIVDYVVDSSRARKLLGWKPKIKLDEGLLHTIQASSAVQGRSS